MKYSWFYVDVITSDGLVLVLVFYSRPFFLSFDISLLDVSIYRSGRKEHFGFPQPQAQSLFRADPVEVNISEGKLVRENNRFHIRLDKKEIYLNMTLTQTFPVSSPADCQLYRKGDEHFKWKVYVPQARAAGILRIGNTEIAINGDGYLDYNEGNFPLNKRLEQWYWGRLHSQSNALIWGALSFKDGTLIQPVLRADHSGVVLETNEFPLPPQLMEIGGPAGIGELKLQERIPFDTVPFLISRLPVNWKLLRKIHEFAFYQLDETNWGKKISRFLSNVQYERSLLAMLDAQSNKYKGLLEYIRFD